MENVIKKTTVKVLQKLYKKIVVSKYVLLKIAIVCYISLKKKDLLGYATS